MRYSISAAVLLLAAFLVLVASAAYAIVPPISTRGWTLTPVVNGNSIQLLLGIDNAALLATHDGEVSKTWGDPTRANPRKWIALGSSGAMLRSLTLTLDGDPKVALKFDVLAGSSDTLFTIPLVANTVSFASMGSANGTATAAITVTDCEDNGALVTGGYSGGKFYRAILNPLSSPLNFTTLISGPVSAVAYGSNTASGSVPPWVSITGPLTSISSEFSFTLSANDEASGTSSFTVLNVPEPGSMVALFTGIIGLVGLATRRKRS